MLRYDRTVFHDDTSLTDESYWDSYWESLRIPTEVKHGDSPYLDSILEVFDRWLPSGSCLEIGGAPGQYLAYLYRRGSRVSALDISPQACEKARANLELLDIPGEVFLGDMFTAEVGRYDVVYSLGLIEHFTDTVATVRAHLRHLTEGGTLLLGCPNLRLLNGWLMDQTAPSVMAHLDQEAIAPRTWDKFERDLGLTRLWRGFLGGFEPQMFWRQEERGVLHRALGQALRMLRLPSMKRHWNSPLWSGYFIGIYRVTPQPTPFGSASAGAVSERARSVSTARDQERARPRTR